MKLPDRSKMPPARASACDGATELFFVLAQVLAEDVEAGRVDAMSAMVIAGRYMELSEVFRGSRATRCDVERDAVTEWLRRLAEAEEGRK